MIEKSLHDLMFGFGVAFEPHNLMWTVFGVLVGNLIGVLPGMGALSAISILLPLTYVMHHTPALLMLAGIFYGSMYGGAIGAILLNLPSHPPHAVTCLDGYPMTRQGRGGTALGITMICSFFAASVGIVVMIFCSPLLVEIAARPVASSSRSRGVSVSDLGWRSHGIDPPARPVHPHPDVLRRCDQPIHPLGHRPASDRVPSLGPPESDRAAPA